MYHACVFGYALCVVHALSLPNQGCHPLSSIIISSSRLTLKLGCGCYLLLRCSFLVCNPSSALDTPPSPFSSLYCAPTHSHSPHIRRYILLSPFWTGTIAHSSTSMSFFGSSDSTRWGGLLKQAISNVETTFDSLLEQQNNEQAQQQQQQQQQRQPPPRRGRYGE